MEQYLVVAFRTLLLYSLILLIFRLMGKREVGELSLLDLVVFIMIGEIAGMAIEEPDVPLIRSILPILLLVGIQLLLAFISLKSKWFRDTIDGRPSIIIKKGKIDEKEMRRHRYNFDDLLLQLREKDFPDISEVEYAILETSGKLSVFPKGEDGIEGGLPVPLVVDGVAIAENLKRIEKSKKWLLQKLSEKGYHDIEKISICSYHNGKFFIDIDNEKK
ncbi:DUF421 domain-containing protein [Mesobacillus zeae]|uniref:DUF421 domain-containing protein n=1 Tax=Mesobacillus zeae TaxID=1917180 RepID=A0A398B1K3_9BACI|nr:DUF421 domain-containing protein [Mesobacillus zeae]RID83727.1 DUF421 domain-containing protein [Mesobacillus zeae]